MLQAQNRFADARMYLERAAGAADLSEESPDAIGRHARRARRLRAGRHNNAGVQTANAGWTVAAGRSVSPAGARAEAEKIYVRLLSENPPSLAVIRAAADFYGSQHQPDKAGADPARLPEAKPHAGMTELATAIYNERWGSADRRDAITFWQPRSHPAMQQPGATSSRSIFALENTIRPSLVPTTPCTPFPMIASLKRLRDLSRTLAQLAADETLHPCCRSSQPLQTILR